jgi:hypothetical protein
MLSMSAWGRHNGGLFLNFAVSIYVLVFLGGVTSFLVAVWRWRKLTENVQLVRLARMPKPTDPVAASVWRWMRAASWA